MKIEEQYSSLNSVMLYWTFFYTFSGKQEGKSHPVGRLLNVWPPIDNQCKCPFMKKNVKFTRFR